MTQTVGQYLKTRTPEQTWCLLRAFALFGFAVREVRHHGFTGEFSCFHVVKSSPDKRKNLFAWDGVHHTEHAAALDSIGNYGAGKTAFTPKNGKTARNYFRETQRLAISHN